MSEVKFVDQLPPWGASAGRTDYGAIVAALSERPGQWAEIERSQSRGVVAGRGNYLANRSAHAGRVEYSVRKVDGEFVLYARVVPS